MVACVTLSLVATPAVGWQRLAAALASGEIAGGAYGLVARVALVSQATTALGWLLRPGSTAAGGVLHVLAATLGHLGGPTIALSLIRHCLGRDEVTDSDEVFLAGTLCPIALAGAFNFVPSVPMSFALAFAGAALSARTGWVGASALLALQGQARLRAAAVPAGLAVGVVLLATSLRMVLPP
jgi:hypothetical protein